MSVWNLHPQANLAASGTTSNPVLAAVEHSYCRNSRDTIAAKLGKLIPRTTVNIDEAVHVSNAEALDVRLRVQLPLRSETEEVTSLAFRLLNRWESMRTYMVTQRPV